MTEFTELNAKPEVLTAAAVTDRRRPGRLQSVSPELIPILRGAEPDLDIEFEEVDQAAAARGVAAGVLLSAPIWAAIAYIGSWFLS